MPSVVPLDKFLGASLIGIIISAVIYGITCMQTYLYYTKYKRNDRWTMKLVVALLWVLDSLHLVLIAIMIYYYTISNWGDVIVLIRTTWSLEVEIVIAPAVAMIVQCFFAIRIWRYSKNWVLAAIIVILSAVQLGFGIAFMVHGFQNPIFAFKGSKTNSFLTGTGLAADIACDFVITVSMCYYLRKNRTGFKGTDTMIDMLITYMIRTCLLTTICTISCLVTFITLPDSLIYQPFYFIGCRLYAMSLLSILNARESILDKSQSRGSEVVSLPRFIGNSSINGDDTTVIGLAPKWLPTEVYRHLQRSLEVFDGAPKPPFRTGRDSTNLVEK
ncbi:hypothetical protein PILCRDRAFT_491229 [Piloderma croceum F 1598]|uniref:DUF6534 domain-containing protein n=1 Tax=Piloderma croceum (strain F 1598) TaxID=765440 RepID=A0A0C3BWS4_PILCF|nr:hypothetical protein PILCRDRAFT_491229 [Piloderma croceum F 1598]